MKNLKISLLIIFLLLSCEQILDKEMTIESQAINNLEAFKTKSKFEPDTIRMFYPGVADPALKPTLTELINKAADDFIEVAKDKEPTENKFQQKISVGLSRFTPLYLELDTEDRERVCTYFEELMDIVGLESSGGRLNEWMYGFDPTDYIKKAH
jgi:hypothetical protein